MRRLLLFLAISLARTAYAGPLCSDFFVARPAISASSLQFERLTDQHRNELHRLFQEPAVSRFFLGGLAAEVAVSRQLARSLRSSDSDRYSYDRLWVLKLSDEIVGLAMMTAVAPSLFPAELTQKYGQNAGDLNVAVGYAIRQAFEGQGLATKALADLITQARDLGAARIFASVNVENESSQTVLRKNGFKVGFKDGHRLKFVLRIGADEN